MGYKVGVDKKQISLLPVCLDEYISENHICRVIDAFTGQLDLCALGYKYAELKDKGCRPYDPRMMLWRSGIEAIISNLKRGFQIRRCTWKGIAHYGQKVFWSVIGYNLRVMTGAILQTMTL